MKKVNKKDIKVIIGFIITGLCTLWITYSTYSNKYWYTGWTNMTLILSTGGIILGGFLMFFGIESKKSKGLFLIVSGSILIGIIIYLMGIMYISLMGIIILGLPIVMVIFGFILLFKPSKQKELKKIKYELKQKSIERKMETTTRNVGIFLLIVGIPFLVGGVYILVRIILGEVYFAWLDLFRRAMLLLLGIGGFLIIPGLALLRKGIRQRELKKIKEKKETIGTKIEAAPNVAYMLRIEKEVRESGTERVDYICGYCGLKNNLRSIDDEHGIFQCLNCGAENHIIK